MKKFAVALLCLTLTGCFAYPVASNTDKTLETMATIMGQKNEKTDTTEKGTKGLVDVSKPITITASDSAQVTIEGQEHEEGEAESALKVMEGELAQLTKDLKYERNAKTEMEQSFQSTEAVHYRVHVVSGLCLLFGSFALLIVVFALWKLRTVLKGYGIDPKIAGKALGKLTSVFNRTKKDNSSTLDVVHRKLADNNLTPEARHELEWFEKVLTKDKEVMKEYNY